MDFVYRSEGSTFRSRMVHKRLNMLSIDDVGMEGAGDGIAAIAQALSEQVILGGLSISKNPIGDEVRISTLLLLSSCQLGLVPPRAAYCVHTPLYNHAGFSCACQGPWAESTAAVPGRGRVWHQ